MAATSITADKLKWNEGKAVTEAAAVNASDGALIDCAGIADQKLLILITNSNASAGKTATIKAGDGIQATDDLELGTIAAGATVAVSVESGAFLITKGANKGKILVKGASADIKVQAIALP